MDSTPNDPTLDQAPILSPGLLQWAPNSQPTLNPFSV